MPSGGWRPALAPSRSAGAARGVPSGRPRLRDRWRGCWSRVGAGAAPPAAAVPDGSGDTTGCQGDGGAADAAIEAHPPPSPLPPNDDDDDDLDARTAARAAHTSGGDAAAAAADAPPARCWYQATVKGGREGRAIDAVQVGRVLSVFPLLSSGWLRGSVTSAPVAARVPRQALM
jgi:hypothetical protein